MNLEASALVIYYQYWNDLYLKFNDKPRHFLLLLQYIKLEIK